MVLISWVWLKEICRMYQIFSGYYSHLIHNIKAAARKYCHFLTCLRTLGLVDVDISMVSMIGMDTEADINEYIEYSCVDHGN